VNTWEESSLADIIWGWGEEQYARRIAHAIIERRSEKPFTTARELAELVKETVPPAYRFGRIHPATKTFQALRIAVNDELGATTEALNASWKLLEPHGRIVVITFHSIEDRLVKEWMKTKESEGHDFISKKAIKPSEQELEENPRARSAKLRVIEKMPV
jgi:16S rRNA (cytosine1402-N4)-methyltransferase